MSEATVTKGTADGATTAPVNLDDLERVASAAFGSSRRVKETDADRQVRSNSYRVTAEELQQFLGRVERLRAELREIRDLEKEVFSEAKGRGYDPKAMREVLKRRAADPDARAEFEALVEMYCQAVGL